MDAALAYECPVSLHESGLAAAIHGMRDVGTPGPAADRLIDKLLARRERRG